MTNETPNKQEQLNKLREDFDKYGLERIDKIDQIAETIIVLSDDPSIVALAGAIQDYCNGARYLYNRPVFETELPF